MERDKNSYKKEHPPETPKKSISYGRVHETSTSLD